MLRNWSCFLSSLSLPWIIELMPVLVLLCIVIFNYGIVNNKVSSRDFDTYSKETMCFQLYMKIVLGEIPY